MLFANLGASTLWETFDTWAIKKSLGDFSWLKFAYLGCFIIFFRLFALQIGPAFHPYTTSLSNEPVTPKNHLILFLSELYFTPAQLVSNGGLPEWLDLTDDIYEDLCLMAAWKQADKRCVWRWEMPLRAIREHIKIEKNSKKLKTVTLLCSPESLPQLEFFYKVFQRYNDFQGVTFQLFASSSNISHLITITDRTDFNQLLRNYQGWEFEDFNKLSIALFNLFKIFKQKNYPDEEIMVDFTGGQKPTSIVAAAMTINRKIKAQYIQTNEPWNAVSYDVHLETAHTGGLL